MARHDGRDDDIQFLYQAEAVIECPTCHRDLGHMSPDQRNAHCNDHFAEESRAGSSTPSPRKQVAGGQKKQRFQSRLFSTKMNSAKEKNDAFWYLSCHGAPPSNFTPGLIPVLKKALAKSHSKGLIQKAYLCSPAVVHVVSEGWDRGWGCGYRNYLMACTALMGQEQQPRYTSLLESPSPPGIRRLQKLIEEAWKEGYDQEGAEQLKNKLTGTSKWIGTAELYVALTYRGVPARLVDFELNRRGPELLVNWIIDYFSQGEGTSRHADINQALLGASPIIITDKPPIVLQHSGHSRTVIGFERKKDGSINLLMFDPSRRIPDPLRQLAISELPSQLSSHGDQRSHSPLKHKLSPSKVVNKVFHPQKSRRKRNASDASIEHARAISSNAKRVRAGDEVIVISDDEGGGESTGMRPTEVDWNKAADIFRVKTKTLEKKDKYQVLYFPMTDPLTPSERQARKVVTSQRIPPVNSM